MLRMLLALMSMAVVLCGCFDQVVRVTSNPAGAVVYSNRDCLGTTPLLTSKDEIMPLWNYHATFTRAVITIQKAGYEDYILGVNELIMPGEIHADLKPLPGPDHKNDAAAQDNRDGIEARLAALKLLRDTGTITNEEFNAKRMVIIDGL